MPRMGDSNHFNRQPRVPQGYTGGGRWTNGDDHGEPVAGPDGATSQFLDPESGAVVRSQYATPGDEQQKERHTITMPDGMVLTYEQSGDLHRVYENGKLVDAYRWTASGPVREPIVRQAFFDDRQARRTTRNRWQAAAALLAALLARPGWRQGGKIIAMSYDLEAEKAGGAAPISRSLTEDDVRGLCKKYDKVKDTFALAEERLKFLRPKLSPSTYGTRVHTEFAHVLNGMIIDARTGQPRFRMPDEAQDPNFLAEPSLLKALRENPSLTRLEAFNQRQSKYAFGGTVRLDAQENVDGKDDLICVYDLKTGNAEMTPARFAEIHAAVRYNFPRAKRLVIIEMLSRPR